MTAFRWAAISSSVRPGRTNSGSDAKAASTIPAARRTDSCSASDLTSRTRSTIQSPGTTRAPPLGEGAAISSTSGAPGDCVQRSTPIAPSLHPRDLDGRADVGDRRRVVVEDGVVESATSRPASVAVVVDEDEPLVCGREKRPDRCARRIPDRLEPGQVVEVRRAQDEQHVHAAAGHPLPDPAGPVAVLGVGERALHAGEDVTTG